MEAKSVAIMNNLQNSDDLLMGGSKLAVNDITEEPEIKILKTLAHFMSLFKTIRYVYLYKGDPKS